MEEQEIVEQSEMEVLIALLTTQVQTLFENFYNVTHTEDWKTYELVEQILFRNSVEALFASAAIIREKFDSDVWKGHSDGTVDPTVTSVRKQREGDTPGRKAVELTPAQVLAKRMNKK